MKASELLKEYKKGERNFSRVNLRGQSFKDQNLCEADFSEADLRSTDFTGANLVKAKFVGAKCGLQKRWVTLLVIFSWLLAGISGFFSIFLGYFVSLIFDSADPEDLIVGWVSLIIIVIFWIFVFRQGLVAVAVAFALAFAVGVGGAVALVVGVGVAEAVAIAGAGTVVVGGAGAVAIAGAGAGAGAGAVALALAFAVGVGGAVALVVGVGVGVGGAVALAFAVGVGGAVALGVAVGVGVAVAVAVGYIAWRAWKGDKRDAWLRSFSVAFAAMGGTSFRGADLTEANLAETRLKSTDLRGANLTGVRWHGAKMLDRVRPGDTYLQNTHIQQWLIGEGKDKNFEGEKLRGINLQGANLVGANFIGADLSGANLQDVDLSRAKLVQTQLDKTDLTGATLTGAFIEDWGITSDTIFQGVRCEYVYMRLPTKEDPEPCRKPDNKLEIFEDGDFADFIKPITQTLDLYHNQGVDPRVIAISWKELAENNSDAELEVVAMERRGEDKFLLRAKTNSKADKSELSAEYFSNYNQYKGLSDGELKALLIEQTVRVEEKIKFIDKFETMVQMALQSPSFYAQNYKGDTNMTSDNRDIRTNTYNEQTGNFGIGVMNDGEIKGNAKVAGEINELGNQDLVKAVEEINKLWKELAQSYPTKSMPEQMIVAAKVIEQIENNPKLKQRVINAAKEAGLAAFEKSFDNPVGAFITGGIKGWLEAEA